MNFRRLIAATLCIVLASSVLSQSNGVSQSRKCRLVVSGGSYFQNIFPSDELNALYLQEFSSSDKRAIYTPKVIFQYASISASCRFVGFLEANDISEELDLRVVSVEGKSVLLVPSVQHFVWGGNEELGDLIAFVVGTDYEGGFGFLSKGTWLLELSSGRRWQIHPGGYDVTWADFDNSFYIWKLWDGAEPDTKVQRYDVGRKELTKTEYDGIYFSPSGTYYYEPSYEGIPFRIFLSAENEDITDHYKALLEGNIIYPRGWIGESRILISSNRPNKLKNRIIDFSSGQKWEAADEVIGFADDEETQLLVLANGKVVQKDFSEATTLVYPPPRLIKDKSESKN